MPFICENCEYTTKRKYHYERHINNKNGCKSKTDVLCKFCEKTFTTLSSCEKHQKKCLNKKKKICKYCENIFTRIYNLEKHFTRCKKNPENIKPKPIEFPCTFCDNTFSSKDDLRIHLKNCLEFNVPSTSIPISISTSTTTNSAPNIINNNTVNNIDNSTNTNIHNHNHNHIIFNFGKENLSHITTNKLRLCYLDPKNSITKMIENIHFNKLHPENRNFKLDNEDSKHVKFYNGNTWIYKKIQPSIKHLADKNFAILEKRYDECINNMSLIAKKDWDNFYYNYLGDEPFIVDYVHDGIIVLLKKHVDI